MIDLVFDSTSLESLQRDLLSEKVERCAVLFASEVRRDRGVRLLVTEIDYPGPSDYFTHTPIEAVLSPHYVARVVKRAKLQKQSLVFVHSHTNGLPAVFSEADDRGEKELNGFLAHRHPDNTHIALVLASTGLAARVLGTEEAVAVVSLGTKRIVHSESEPNASVERQFDRQVRAFGAQGQRELQRLRVGVVGAGGTGSVLIQQLAHLGTRDFLIIDPDNLDATNLNRVVGSRPDDVGKDKVSIAKRNVGYIAPQAVVEAVVGDVTRISTAALLEDVDFIFICTDSHGSRSVAQQIAYQYVIPAIDVGTVIVAREGLIESIIARVQLLSGADGCLWCSNLLSAQEIRREMMSEEERRLDPYLRGAREPAPAVISLNSTAVSLAVTMFLGVVTAAPIQGRYLLYNALTGTLRSVRAAANPDCLICSTQGVRAKGDSRPLFARAE